MVSHPHFRTDQVSKGDHHPFVSEVITNDNDASPCRAHMLFLEQILNPVLHKFKSLECQDAVILFLRGLIQAAKRKLSHDMRTLLSVSLYLTCSREEKEKK